jgi:hypothetical protein
VCGSAANFRLLSSVGDLTEAISLTLALLGD